MEEAHNHMEEKDSTDGGSTCRAARRSLFQTSAGEYVNDPKDSSISSTASLGEVHGSGTDDGPKYSHKLRSQATKFRRVSASPETEEKSSAQRVKAGVVMSPATLGEQAEEPLPAFSQESAFNEFSPNSSLSSSSASSSSSSWSSSSSASASPSKVECEFSSLDSKPARSASPFSAQLKSPEKRKSPGISGGGGGEAGSPAKMGCVLDGVRGLNNGEQNASSKEMSPFDDDEIELETDEFGNDISLASNIPGILADSFLSPPPRRSPSTSPAAEQAVVGWARMAAADGDGNLMRHITSFFIADLLPEDLGGMCPRELRLAMKASLNEERPLALSTAVKEPLSHADLLASSGVCKALASAVDSALASLVAPDGVVSCKPKPVVPTDEEVEEGVTVCPKTTEAREFQTLLKTRPGLGVFMAQPERRMRAYTASDNQGRVALDGLYGNPVFCVRYRGIRRGKTLFSTSTPRGDEGSGWNHGPRNHAETGGIENWPLQLHTYFKMRTYTKFERLMGVYAGRSHLPLPWLTFKVTDRLYGISSDAASGSGGGGSSSISHLELPEAVTSKITNNGRKPLLPYGGRIRPSHSLWTLGIEPGDGGLDNAKSEEARMEDEAEEDVVEEEAGEVDMEAAAPVADAAPAQTAAQLMATIAQLQAQAAELTQIVAAAAAAEEEAEEEEVEEEEEEDEEEEGPPAVAEDVWVDSYLTCAEDEVFVCVRDKRDGCEDLERTPPAVLPRFGGNGLEHGAMSAEGALIGDNVTLTGPFAAAGRFGAGDAGADLPSQTRSDDPGQPVRPPHPGWLFRMKVTDPIYPALRRVLNEIDLSAASAAARKKSAEAREARRVEAAAAAAAEAARASGLSSPSPSPLSSARATPVETSDSSPSSGGSGREEPSPRVLASSLLRFVAVAPLGHFGGGREQGVPVEHWHTDTAVDATARAVFGMPQGGGASDSSSSRVAPKWVYETPMHVVELHNLSTFEGMFSR